jgi:hypothetical protein
LSCALTLGRAFAHAFPFPTFTMSKQYNKEIKRKRRSAYLKRKKAATKKTTKSAAKK